MIKKIIIVLIILLGSFTVYRLLSQKPDSLPNENANLVLFWGDGCPHCENVEKYIKDNKIDTKIPIDKKEVFYNKTNQKTMFDYVQKCPELKGRQDVGVPFAFIKSDNKCLIGDQPIIDYLKNSQANTQ